MATLLANDPINLAGVGFGVGFTGFIVIAPPNGVQPMGSAAGGEQLLLIAVSNGVASTQFLYEGHGLMTAFTGAIQDGDNYRIGVMPGNVEALTLNIDYVNLPLRTCEGLASISGSVELASLISAPGGALPDTTGPSLTIENGAPN